MARSFGEFFVVSVRWETKHENSSNNWGNFPGKIRRKIRETIRDETSKNSGELSFCNFSDLTKVGDEKSARSFSAQVAPPGVMDVRAFGSWMSAPTCVFFFRVSRACPKLLTQHVCTNDPGTSADPA